MLHRTMSGGFELLDDGTPRRAEPGVDGVANWLAAVRAMPACGLCRATPAAPPSTRQLSFTVRPQAAGGDVVAVRRLPGCVEGTRHTQLFLVAVK